MITCPKCHAEFDEPAVVRQPTLRGLGPIVDTPIATPPKYPATFDRIWEATGRKGTKYEALRAWKRAGQPVDIVPAWEAYLKSDHPVRLGAVKDLSTWLNQMGHQQKWMAVEARCPWHMHQRNHGTKSNVPRDTCPSCREYTASTRVRVSEPVAVGVPSWLSQPPPAWTDAEKADFEASKRK